MCPECQLLSRLGERTYLYQSFEAKKQKKECRFRNIGLRIGQNSAPFFGFLLHHLPRALKNDKTNTHQNENRKALSQYRSPFWTEWRSVLRSLAPTLPSKKTTNRINTNKKKGNISPTGRDKHDKPFSGRFLSPEVQSRKACETRVGWRFRETISFWRREPGNDFRAEAKGRQRIICNQAPLSRNATTIRNAAKNT